MSKGFGIILCIDDNENINDRRIQKLLLKLGISETISMFTNDSLPLIFYKGSKQIDAVWTFPTTKPLAVSIAPFQFRVGDYRVFILDFLIDIILDKEFIPIYKS